MPTKFELNRTFGVEIETFHPTYTKRDLVEMFKDELSFNAQVSGYGGSVPSGYWNITHDGSLKGKNPTDNCMEVVTPILKGEQGLKDLKAVCDLLDSKGFKVNKSCGIHVHQDANDFNWKDLKKLVTLVIGFEQTIYKMLPESRRGQYYCREANPENIKAMLRSTNEKRFKEGFYKGTKKEGRGNRGHESRYHGLNLNSWWYRGTVEFRYFNGSVEFDKIQAWIYLTQAMVEFSKQAKSIKFEKQLSPKSIKLTNNIHEARLYTLLDYINLTGHEQDIVDVRKRLFERINKFADLPSNYYYFGSRSFYTQHENNVHQCSVQQNNNNDDNGQSVA